MAVPSARNSGLERIWNSTPGLVQLRSSTFWMASAVRTGTVDCGGGQAGQRGQGSVPQAVGGSAEQRRAGRAAGAAEKGDLGRG